ncbi:septin aspe [Trichoderma arundinaceum]|uniref:Septin aspe n=1 Tax=Trichoderma arundinaceum TaxID=490622 RepID=A0A395P0Q6_TRIAR|nr:septin aspe [Trichoderma arundinaceum]
MSSPPRRSSSFGMLLKRTKSGDLGKGNRKTQAELDRQHQPTSRAAPKLPEFFGNTEQLSKSFAPELQANSIIPSGNSGRESSSRSSAEPTRAASNKIPIPPIPSNGFDPYARSESMTNRGRYSYASSSAMSTINNPRRIRRRKDPTPFNILILGTQNAGKTSFLEFLKTALALPPKKQSKKQDEDVFQTPIPPVGNFIPHYLETEIDGERVGLTLWDSEGLEKNVVDLQLREMSAFLESKFEETFAEEMKVVRSPGVKDTHIHAAFYVMDPSRLDRNIATAKNASSRNGFSNGNYGHARASGALDEEVDLQVLRTLQHKTTVIPVISKADTITTKHMSVLRKAVWDSIKSSNLDPLEALGLDEDSSSIIEEEAEYAEADESVEQVEKTPVSPGHAKRLSSNSIRRHKSQEVAKDEEPPFLPLSIISPDLYEPSIVGRQFPWGFADPYSEEHCDFVRLKEAVFTEWRAELREASREQWYEGWRTNRLKHRDLPYAR